MTAGRQRAASASDPNLRARVGFGILSCRCTIPSLRVARRNMKSPFLSVVVATHERPWLLARTLDSLVSQSYRDFEIVLCADEGSADTKAAATRYLRKQDIFLAVPHVRGPAETRNAGVQFATGRYVLFLDDDDTFEADFLSQVSNSLSATACDSVLYFNYTEVLESRQEGGVSSKGARRVSLKEVNPALLWVQNFIPNNTFAVEARLAAKVRFDVHLRSHEDWDYLLALAQVADFKHVDIFGPNVHHSDKAAEHRNYAAVIDGSTGIDYISIYRKWPAQNDDIRSRRSELLKSLGVGVNPAFL